MPVGVCDTPFPFISWPRYQSFIFSLCKKEKRKCIFLPNYYFFQSQTCFLFLRYKYTVLKQHLGMQGEKQTCVKYSGILMQIQSRVLSRPDYNSANLRSTRVCPPLLSRKIIADCSHSICRLKQSIHVLLLSWNLIIWSPCRAGGHVQEGEASHSFLQASTSAPIKM